MGLGGSWWVSHPLPHKVTWHLRRPAIGGLPRGGHLAPAQSVPPECDGAQPRNSIQVWRRTDERFNPDCLAPTFKSGRSSVMVWGAFVDSTTLPLVVMPPRRRTAADFVDIVYQSALGPFLEAHDDASSLTLMEDGACQSVGATVPIRRHPGPSRVTPVLTPGSGDTH